MKIDTMAQTKFQEEVYDVVRSGQTSGLSDTEILKLFTNSGSDGTERDSGRTRRSWTGWICRWLFVISGSAIAFFIILSIMLNYKPAEYYIDHYGHHLAYPLLRYSRLLTLPLSRRVDVSSFYYQDCLLSNPFFEVERDCSVCQDTADVRIVDLANPEVGLHVGESWAQPIIWKDVATQDVTLDRLIDTVQRNVDVFQSTMKVTLSVNTTIHSVQDFLDRKQHLSSYHDMFLLWQVRGAGALKSIRDLSWRPADVETNPMMYIQIKGHAAGDTALPVHGVADSNALVSQAQGTSTVRLSAVEACQDQCKATIVGTLSPRDVLSFNQQYWELTTTSRGSEVNLSFISFFY